MKKIPTNKESGAPRHKPVATTTLTSNHRLAGHGRHTSGRQKADGLVVDDVVSTVKQGQACTEHVVIAITLKPLGQCDQDEVKEFAFGRKNGAGNERHHVAQIRPPRGANYFGNRNNLHTKAA